MKVAYVLMLRDGVSSAALHVYLACHHTIQSLVCCIDVLHLWLFVYVMICSASGCSASYLLGGVHKMNLLKQALPSYELDAFRLPGSFVCTLIICSAWQHLHCQLTNLSCDRLVH